MENPKIENRQRMANVILKNREYFKHIVSITFETDNKLSIKAAWILEWICTHHYVEWILPHLDEFTSKIATVKYDSALRPCAKICEQLATLFYSKEDHSIKKILTQQHIDRIVAVGFEWLITPQKIAVRAYTMKTLYLFGLEKKWIHPELATLISTKIIHESKGCRARGRHILELINKNSALDYS